MAFNAVILDSRLALFGLAVIDCSLPLIFLPQAIPQISLEGFIGSYLIMLEVKLSRTCST
jgi:hypothetical protein